MHIISERRIREFWESRRGDADDAEKYLRDWIKLARRARWKDFAALKQTFGSADKVGDCVVFDVGANRYRLIGRVRFDVTLDMRGRLYILKIMDHREYDRDAWKSDCGCFEAPPKSRGQKGGGR